MTAKHLLDEIVRGLDGVTAGPWTTWPNSPWAVREDTHNGWQILAPLHRSKDEVVRNAEHIARCSPDAMRDIAAYVRDLEERLAKAAEALEQAETDRAEQWRLRRDAEGSRDAAAAAADSLRIERDMLRTVLSDISEGWDFWQVNPHDREPPRDAIRRARTALSQIRSEK